ncbi:MAG: universal stress protein [Sphingomonadales bacterium]|nr:universal stress protein [Sphingomonadales bacterium]
MIYLVAIDGSECSDRAADRAIALAKQTGAEVHFITVLAQFGHRTSSSSGEDLEAATRTEIFDPLKERFDNSGIEIKYDLYWGNPVEVINEQAKNEGVNKIFVGRRGRSKVLGMLLGSVSNSLAQITDVPVVLVP